MAGILSAFLVDDDKELDEIFQKAHNKQRSRAYQIFLLLRDNYIME